MTSGRKSRWCKVKFECLRSTPWIATIDLIVVNEFEPLLLTNKAGGLTRVGLPLYMRARFPVQLQNNYDAYKNGKKTHRTGIRLQKHWKPRAREQSRHDEVWSKRSDRKPCLWSSPRPKSTKHLQGSQFRTLADPTRETDRGIGHKLIVGCEEHNIDIIAIPEQQLTSTNPINYQRFGDWTLAHTT